MEIGVLIFKDEEIANRFFLEAETRSIIFDREFGEKMGRQIAGCVSTHAFREE